MILTRTSDDFDDMPKFGKLPKGWRLRTVGDCFDFIPTATYSRDYLKETGDCAYIHYGDIHTKFDEFIDFSKSSLPHISNTHALRFTKVVEGDIVLADASEDYEGVGKAVEIINVNEKQIVSGLHTIHLHPKDDCLLNGFKGYLFLNRNVRKQILRAATGIKVYSIAKSSLRKILLPIPTQREQKRMMDALRKIDNAISLAKETVIKLETIKKSLMANLLTGRLKSNGEWRSPADFYEDPKLGRVPIGWHVKKWGDLIRLEYGKSLKTRTGEIPVYGTNGQIGFTDRPIINNEGIVVGRKGEYREVHYSSTPFWVIDTAFYVVPREAVDTKWAYYSLKRLDINRFDSGSAIPSTNKKDIYHCRVAFPNTISEQHQISERIFSIQQLIQSKTEKVERLEKLRSAFLQNLLSGINHLEIVSEQLAD